MATGLAAFEGDESIYLQVRQLIDLPQFAGAQLLTSADLAHRRVRWTSVQELPLAGFVRPDELVMTTAIGLEDDPERLAELVREVARAGAACLAVAVGQYVSRIPEAVIGQAEANALSLIQLPWELKFSEITEAVLGHVLEGQHELVRKAQDIHEALTDMVLKDGNLDAICRTVADLIHRAVQVLDPWGEVLSESSPGNAQSWPAELRLPIQAGGSLLGSLQVGSAGDRLSELDLQIARHAATAAALLMMVDRAVAEAEARSEGEFVASVLNGTEAADAVDRRARVLGVDPKGPYQTVYITFERARDEGRDASELRWALEHLLASRRMSVLKAWYGFDVALLFGPGPIGPEEQTRTVFEALSSRRYGQAGSEAPTAGISAWSGHLSEASKGFREAVMACRLGRGLYGVGSVTRYGDLGAYPALAVAFGSDAGGPLRELEDRYLGPLLEYEALHGLPLVATLAALFDSNGNVSEAARRIALNRQSFLYRLEKVEALTGVSLGSSTWRFVLELAVRSRAARETVA